jgi:Domain of unknown function (DUF4337)
MAETPEIPEAEDAFSKRVAISVAVLAVCISFINNFGDNAKTDSIIKTTQAANQWSYFQAKSVKQHAFGLEKDLLTVMAPGSVDPTKRDELIKSYEKKIAKYDQEKKDIGFGEKDPKGNWVEVKGDDGKQIVSASQLEEEAAQGIKINDRCDFASLLLSLAVILCSVAILMKHHYVWFIGLAIGLGGAVVGSTAFLM